MNVAVAEMGMHGLAAGDGTMPILSDADLRAIRQSAQQRLLQGIDHFGNDVINDRGALRESIDDILADMAGDQPERLPMIHRRKIAEQILDDLIDCGPLSTLMRDDGISDILINGPHEIWIDRRGRLEKTELGFDDDAHLRRVIDRLAAAQGRHLDASHPLIDARLADGSRLHAVIPPLCAQGTVVSIRRHRESPLSADDLVQQGVLNQPMMDLIKALVEARLNIVVSGGASAGKTTLLNLAAGFIPAGERVVTIEETAELRLPHPHVVALECRLANSEGRGAVGLSDLLRAALRMRADRILVGEVRGKEVLDMLQAMNIGHDGSLTSIHSSGPEDTLRRIEWLAAMAGDNLSSTALRPMIAGAVQAVVHLRRFPDGSRRVTDICAVKSERGEPTLQPLCSMAQTATRIGQAPAHRPLPELGLLLSTLRVRGALVSPKLREWASLAEGAQHAA